MLISTDMFSTSENVNESSKNPKSGKPYLVLEENQPKEHERVVLVIEDSLPRFP